MHKENQVFLYDTTLRDGSQMRGLSFSLEDKINITKRLDRMGIPYIEGGWPGSNPKDCAYFHELKKLNLKSARPVAFGSTRRAGTSVEADANLKALLDAETPTVTLVGKTWVLHVEKVLETTLEENLCMIRESILYMKEQGREVIYDAEHFFDGYRDNPEYALETLKNAALAGADWLVLCDTNGGSLPSFVYKTTQEIRTRFMVPVGVHTHNDSELAVANAIAAVEAGARMVQGTINGYGERCGNANLISLIPIIQTKMGLNCLKEEHMQHLTEFSRFVSEIANINPNPNAPFVGASAFAHKGGIHVAAVEKLTESYEHIPPHLVGNKREIVISELSGRGNIRMLTRESRLNLKGKEREVLDKVKKLESQGFHFEAAEESFELLGRRALDSYHPPFELIDFMVVSEEKNGESPTSQAMVKLNVEDTVLHTAASGNGPVNALDLALRKALIPCYPQLKDVRLIDYKVRILNHEKATGATTRVLIEAAYGEKHWSTVGCSENILKASCQALIDSLEYFLIWQEEQNTIVKGEGELRYAHQTV